jgi:hypothetical protein
MFSQKIIILEPQMNADKRRFKCRKLKTEPFIGVHLRLSAVSFSYKNKTKGAMPP